MKMIEATTLHTPQFPTRESSQTNLPSTRLIETMLWQPSRLALEYQFDPGDGSQEQILAQAVLDAGVIARVLADTTKFVNILLTEYTNQSTERHLPAQAVLTFLDKTAELIQQKYTQLENELHLSRVSSVLQNHFREQATLINSSVDHRLEQLFNYSLALRYIMEPTVVAHKIIAPLQTAVEADSNVNGDSGVETLTIHGQVITVQYLPAVGETKRSVKISIEIPESFDDNRFLFSTHSPEVANIVLSRCITAARYELPISASKIYVMTGKFPTEATPPTGT